MRGDDLKPPLALGNRQQVKPRSSARRKPAGKSPIAPGEVTPGPIPSPGAHPYCDHPRFTERCGECEAPLADRPVRFRGQISVFEAPSLPEGEWVLIDGAVYAQNVQRWLDELAAKLNAEGKR